MRSKINLFFENIGTAQTISKREPFLNAIPSKIVSKVILNSKMVHPVEAYFGVGSGQFFNRFKIHADVPHGIKFYYPIIYSLSELTNYIDFLKIPAEIIKLIKDRQCKILIVCPYEGWAWSVYDYLVESLAAKHDLSCDNFVVMCGNMTTNHKYKTVYFNNWEISSKQRDPDKDRQLGHNAIFGKNSRDYKFICLNRRATVHRFPLITRLYPYRKEGLLSFCQVGFQPQDHPPTLKYYHYQKEAFKFDYPNIYNDWVNLNIEDSLPLILPKDLDPYDITRDSVNPTNDEYPDKFYNSYLHIVAETTAKGSGFFSEKMFKPIIYFQPFVLIGQYRALENFKKLGYQTFSDIIDESYDEEVNLELRLEKAVSAAINFFQRSDLNVVMKNLWPRLEYNHSLLVHRFTSILDQLQVDLEKALHYDN